MKVFLVSALFLLVTACQWSVPIDHMFGFKRGCVDNVPDGKGNLERVCKAVYVEDTKPEN